MQSSLIWVFCVEVLRPSQPIGVMSSAVSLPNHTFTGQAWSSKWLTSIVHILSPETGNCPSWISGRERMTVENISWSISTKECCRPRRGLNPRPPGLQSDGASNWATEAGSLIWVFWLCWGLTTRQPLWVILCRLPEKGRRVIEEIVEEMKERNREERGTGMKVKKQKK